MDDVLLAVLLFIRSSLVCRWWIELVDDSGRLVIRSLQDVTRSANVMLGDGVENAWPVGPPAELFVGQKIGPVHPPR